MHAEGGLSIQEVPLHVLESARRNSFFSLCLSHSPNKQLYETTESLPKFTHTPPICDFAVDTQNPEWQRLSRGERMGSQYRKQRWRGRDGPWKKVSVFSQHEWAQSVFGQTAVSRKSIALSLAMRSIGGDGGNRNVKGQGREGKSNAPQIASGTWSRNNPFLHRLCGHFTDFLDYFLHLFFFFFVIFFASFISRDLIRAGLMGTICWRKILKNSTGRQLPLYHNEYEEIVQKNKQTTTKTTERQRFGLSMRKTLIYSWASAAIMFLWMDFWFTTIARFHSYDEIYVFKCEYVF